MTPDINKGVSNKRRASDSRLLLDRFVDRGLISVFDVRRVEAMQRTTYDSYINLILRADLVPADRLADAQADILELPRIEPQFLLDEHILIARIDKSFALRRRVIPFQTPANKVGLAMVDATDTEAVSMLRLLFDEEVEPYVVSADHFDEFVQRLKDVEDIADEPDVEISTLSEDDAIRLADLAREAPVVGWVDSMLRRAHDLGASDVHIDPKRDGFDIRFRVDGVLQMQTLPSDDPASIIVSRIKILAKLDIAERRLPQDGRFRLMLNGQNVDFRVATIPGVFGEAVVLRLLAQGTERLTLEQLGFHTQARERLEQGLAEPHGIVLVTGPTGSGKSTTLYAALQSLVTDARKFMSVEDPVEYQVGGVTQVQVKPEIGLDFARTLRSVLRHDPNVLMVGEIRDPETAKVAFQASLTGHTVLSTLHTNSAAATITRLIEMGVEDYLVTSCIRTIVAQRLVRKLCTDCRVPVEATPDILSWAGLEAGEVDHLFHADGCSSCRGTGYSGRGAIGEVMSMTPELQKCVLDGGSELDIRTIAEAQEMLSLKQAGVEAILRGYTSFPEVVSAIGAGR